MRRSIILGAIAVAWLGTATEASGCGAELTPRTSLWSEFELEPEDLPWLSDDEAAVLVLEETNRRRSHRFAIARSVLWDPLLRFRVEDPPQGAEIPVSRGRWRFGPVRHPRSGRRYEVVHWADVEGPSATLYFRAGTTVLCQLAFEDPYSSRTSIRPPPRKPLRPPCQQ